MKTEVDIQSIWAVEQEILDVIDQVCQKYNLRYSLAYGTLLGVVRHGGFIPWDDDLDIMMPRDDYNKLLQIWEKEVSGEYILQDYYREPEYINNFAKVRKDKTTFLQDKEDVNKKYHKGLFVDIFPADYVATGKVRRAIQYIACAANLLYSRGRKSGTGGIIGIIEKILLLVPFKYYTKMRRMTEKIMCMYNKEKEEFLFFPCTISDCKIYYPGNMFDDLQKKIFNGKEYCVVRDYDSILKKTYGDYMQLPPEEERVWRHHPVLIDFEHNCDEIVRGEIS